MGMENLEKSWDFKMFFFQAWKSPGKKIQSQKLWKSNGNLNGILNVVVGSYLGERGLTEGGGDVCIYRNMTAMHLHIVTRDLFLQIINIITKVKLN